MNYDHTRFTYTVSDAIWITQKQGVKPLKAIYLLNLSTYRASLSYYVIPLGRFKHLENACVSNFLVQG